MPFCLIYEKRKLVAKVSEVKRVALYSNFKTWEVVLKISLWGEQLKMAHDYD